jgi:bacterioferritin
MAQNKKDAKKKAPMKPAKKLVDENVEDTTDEEANGNVVPQRAKKTAGSSDLVSHLDQILEAELSGVVRYLHYSFMIFGPNRIPITKWFREHALEGINHAVVIGEKITALGGHPSIKIQPVPETNDHNVLEILKEGLEFEEETLRLYKDTLDLLDGDVALEEVIRGLIKEETEHIEEVKKMIRNK